MEECRRGNCPILGPQIPNFCTLFEFACNLSRRLHGIWRWFMPSRLNSQVTSIQGILILPPSWNIGRWETIKLIGFKFFKSYLVFFNFMLFSGKIISNHLIDELIFAWFYILNEATLFVFLLNFNWGARSQEKILRGPWLLR